MDNSTDIRDQLIIGARELSIDLSLSQTDLLIRYLLLLHKWNKVFNLTAIHNYQHMVSHHLLDSLSVSPYLTGRYIIDVGTGAGLPGIPLAISLPDQHFTLLDSNGKKKRFLTQVKIELGLSNVTIAHCRAENFYPETLFDVVISRAFASIKCMLSVTSHLCKTDGYFLAMKGLYPVDELTSVKSPFKLVQVSKLVVPGINKDRHVLAIKNIDGLPA